MYNLDSPELAQFYCLDPAEDQRDAEVLYDVQGVGKYVINCPKEPTFKPSVSEESGGETTLASDPLPVSESAEDS